MITLAIETSCDETSASLVKRGREILSNIVTSQAAIHSKFNGVVPELASRAHVENINTVVAAALTRAGIKRGEIKSKIGCVVYIKGPGLAGPLVVGQVAAQAFAFLHGLPLVGVNHIEAHIYSALLDYPELNPPYLALVASGGHTELVIVKGFGKYSYLGGTRDDAAGEAFDKVAKLLGLGYPGGPAIDKLAKRGNAGAVNFPRPLLPGTWDFSFSGLKTSVLNYLKSGKKAGIADICASFQAAVVDTLVTKTLGAAEEFGMKKIALGGGVAANSALRASLNRKAAISKHKVFMPNPGLCTDNAAMAACAGYYKFKLSRADKDTSRIEPGLQLENW